jgi:hypothetical protein
MCIEEQRYKLVRMVPVSKVNHFLLIQNVYSHETILEMLSLDNSFLSTLSRLKNISFQGKLRAVDLFLYFFLLVCKVLKPSRNVHYAFLKYCPPHCGVSLLLFHTCWSV